jgi:hypothetical protein
LYPEKKDYPTNIPDYKNLRRSALFSYFLHHRSKFGSALFYHVFARTVNVENMLKQWLCNRLLLSV